MMARRDREQSAFVGSKAPTSYQLNRLDATDSRRIEVVTRFAVKLLLQGLHRRCRAYVKASEAAQQASARNLVASRAGIALRGNEMKWLVCPLTLNQRVPGSSPGAPTKQVKAKIA